MMSEHKIKRIAIESPFAGDVPRNIRYAIAAMRHVMKQGHAPFASHLLYTIPLDDTDEIQRKLGMRFGFAHADACEERWVFFDHGISSGMKAGVSRGEKRGQPIRYIKIPNWHELIADIPQEAIDAMVKAMTVRKTTEVKGL